MLWIESLSRAARTGFYEVEWLSTLRYVKPAKRASEASSMELASF